LYFRRRWCIVSDVARVVNRGGSKPSKAVPPRPGRRRIVQALLLFVASIIVIDGLVGDRGLLATRRAQRDYDAAVAALARQRAENARLREEARRLREDPAAIEEIARRELGLVRRGEKVFIIKDVPAGREAPAQAEP
jgi:cell division protein FtsB